MIFVLWSHEFTFSNNIFSETSQFQTNFTLSANGLGEKKFCSNDSSLLTDFLLSSNLEDPDIWDLCSFVHMIMQVLRGALQDCHGLLITEFLFRCLGIVCSLQLLPTVWAHPNYRIKSKCKQIQIYPGNSKHRIQRVSEVYISYFQYFLSICN